MRGTRNIAGQVFHAAVPYAERVPTAAEQAHGIRSILVLGILVLIVAGIGYVIACWIWPYAACLKCKGAGRFKTSSGKAWRRCRRCKGSGERLRVGRKIYNHVTRIRRDAS